VAARPSRRELQAAWQQRLKRARSLYVEKVAILKEMLAERRGRVWPINLEPDPDGRFALHLALQEESAARTEYMRILRIVNEFIREGTLLAARGENSCFDVRVTEMRTRSGMIERRHYLPVGYSRSI
jgi:hypothetical protein